MILVNNLSFYDWGVTGGRPTTVAELDRESSVDANVDAMGWWGRKDAPPSTLAEHYRMGLQWPSSSYPPCEHG
jgi:hypothetical protein